MGPPGFSLGPAGFLGVRRGFLRPGRVLWGPVVFLEPDGPIRGPIGSPSVLHRFSIGSQRAHMRVHRFSIGSPSVLGGSSEGPFCRFCCFLLSRARFCRLGPDFSKIVVSRRVLSSRAGFLSFSRIFGRVGPHAQKLRPIVVFRLRCGISDFEHAGAMLPLGKGN